MLLVFKITLKRFLIIGYVNKYKNERINSLINSEKNNQLSQPFVLKVNFKKNCNMIKEIDRLISCFLLLLGVSLCELLIELIPGTFCSIITRKKRNFQ